MGQIYFDVAAFEPQHVNKLIRQGYIPCRKVRVSGHLWWREYKLQPLDNRRKAPL